MMDDVKCIIEKLKSQKTSDIITCLQDICINYVKNKTKMNNFVKHSIFELLISYVGQPQFYNITLSIIADACLHEEWVEKVIKNNGIKSICGVITCSVNEDISHRACRAVGNIAKFRINALIENNIVELISSIINIIDSSNSKLSKQTAVRTLRILGENTKAREIILQKNGIFYICKLMHCSDKNLILNSIRALAKLTEPSTTDYTNQILKGQSLKDIIDLYSHKNNDIQMFVMIALKNISALESARSPLIKEGGVNLFSKVATDSNSIEIKKLALLGLCGCLNYMHMWEGYGTTKDKGLKLLVDTLSLTEFESIHITILNSLLPLVTEQGTARTLINLELISSLIIRLMNFMNHNDPHDISTFVAILSSIEDSALKENDCFGLKQDNLLCMHFNIGYLSRNFFRSEISSFSYSKCFSDNDGSKYFSNHIHATSTETEMKNNNSATSCVKNKKTLDVCHPILKCEQNSSVFEETYKNNYISQSEKRICDLDKNDSKKLKLSDQCSQNSQNTPRVHLKSSSIPMNRTLRIDNFILTLLSHLTPHLKKQSPLTSKSCFSTLMLYIYCIPNADSKAEKILLETIKNRNLFEQLIVNGFVSKLEEILKITHNQNVCEHCSHIVSVKRKFTSAMCKEAESDFGIGTLGHILCCYKRVEISNALYAISKILHLKTALYKLLIHHNGLEVICNILAKSTETDSIDIINCLCSIYQNMKANNKSFPFSCCVSRNCSFKVTTKCSYQNDAFDVTFVVDNGAEVSASRVKICQNSDYFRAFLDGNFSERNQSVVTIQEISAETLTIIFHFLHGCCKKELCAYVHNITFPSSLELFRESEKFLLKDIKIFALDRLCHFLHWQTALTIYEIAKFHNSNSLSEMTLNFLLCQDVSENKCLKCFQDFLKLDKYGVIDDIKKIFCKIFELKINDYKF